MNREIPLQESHYFASFLLKRDIELDQIETLEDDELEKLIAETKTIAFIDTDVKRHKKLMAAYFYEYALLKYQKRIRE
tara:strand:- start:1172 stop:1405 length:234 start_codon:yes stop_codon:yes gene_type:complete